MIFFSAKTQRPSLPSQWCTNTSPPLKDQILKVSIWMNPGRHECQHMLILSEVYYALLHTLHDDFLICLSRLLYLFAYNQQAEKPWLCSVLLKARRKRLDHERSVGRNTRRSWVFLPTSWVQPCPTHVIKSEVNTKPERKKNLTLTLKS